jgi:hypothetical protein
MKLSRQGAGNNYQNFRTLRDFAIASDEDKLTGNDKIAYHFIESPARCRRKQIHGITYRIPVAGVRK